MKTKKEMANLTVSILKEFGVATLNLLGITLYWVAISVIRVLLGIVKLGKFVWTGLCFIGRKIKAVWPVVKVRISNTWYIVTFVTSIVWWFASNSIKDGATWLWVKICELMAKFGALLERNYLKHVRPLFNIREEIIRFENCFSDLPTAPVSGYIELKNYSDTIS